MNLKIANRLLAYRRAYGYSQEDLAEKIGVSRQAVSKWERAEAAPDTDNLIALAALYGVLIDELINGEGEPRIKSEQADDQSAPETPEENNGTTDPTHDYDDVGINYQDGGDKVHIDAHGVHISDADDDHDNINIQGHIELELDSKLFPITAILCTIAYLVVGFCLPRGWECGWVLYMLVPVVPTLVTAIVKRKPTEFLFPVFVTGLYLAAGMVFGRWHPEWIMFLTIPIYYIIADYAEKRHKKE